VFTPVNKPGRLLRLPLSLLREKASQVDEGLLREKAITFIQPTGFMSNLLAWRTSIKAEGTVRSSTGEGRRAFIHSDDIAAV
jgi:uncharacterized protein YbjT (DUF2867 family)